MKNIIAKIPVAVKYSVFDTVDNVEVANFETTSRLSSKELKEYVEKECGKKTGCRYKTYLVGERLEKYKMSMDDFLKYGEKIEKNKEEE